jgi:hypothetical protein
MVMCSAAMPDDGHSTSFWLNVYGFVKRPDAEAKLQYIVIASINDYRPVSDRVRARAECDCQTSRSDRSTVFTHLLTMLVVWVIC